ncbi:MAG: hypothetical protein IIV68_01010 [Alistipes sp.]|nr:hypothetical protein [Alistipes sp.]
MKKIISVVALLCAIFATSCNGGQKDTLPKDILAEWHLIENPLITGSTDDIVDVYLEFKADGTFVLYQKDFNTPIYYKTYTGTYLLTETLLTGKYSDGKNWGSPSGYTASYSQETQLLTLVSIDRPEDISVYEKKAVPSDIKGAAVTMTTRGEEIFDVVRFL